MDINPPMREYVLAIVREVLPELLREIPPAATSVDPDAEYIDTKELSRRTGFSVQFFECGRSHKNPDRPPFYKKGRRVLYKWSECKLWLERREGAGR